MRAETPAMLVLGTERLLLRWFRAEDADTVLALVNDPDWLRNIGDRGVRTREQALAFVADRLVEPCWRHGFGHWAVERRDTGACIGMCGFVQRDGLPDPDLGYALLPAHRGQGFAREAAAACLGYADRVLGERRVLAILSRDNAASAAVLRAVGMHRLAPVTLPGAGAPSELWEWRDPAPEGSDAAQIDALVARFFAAFDQRRGIPAVASLPALMLPGASVTIVTAAGVTTTDVRGFVAPRAELLFGPRMRDFAEHEVEHETRIDGALAQRWLRYRKHGVLDGAPFTGAGRKALQLVRTPRGWRIASVAWRDDDVPDRR
jgi:RimJ/RimL family protein N-acetyltransferase